MLSKTAIHSLRARITHHEGAVGWSPNFAIRARSRACTRPSHRSWCLPGRRCPRYTPFPMALRVGLVPPQPLKLPRTSVVRSRINAQRPNGHVHLEGDCLGAHALVAKARRKHRSTCSFEPPVLPPIVGGHSQPRASPFLPTGRPVIPLPFESQLYLTTSSSRPKSSQAPSRYRVPAGKRAALARHPGSTRPPDP